MDSGLAASSTASESEDAEICALSLKGRGLDGIAAQRMGEGLTLTRPSLLIDCHALSLAGRGRYNGRLAFLTQ